MRIILLLLLFCNSALACEVIRGSYNKVLIPAKEDTPIKSPVEGIVSNFYIYNPKQYHGENDPDWDIEGDTEYIGTFVSVEMRDGTYAIFMNLKGIAPLRRKERVNIGDVIGYVGAVPYMGNRPMVAYVRSEIDIYDFAFPPPQDEIEYLLKSLNGQCNSSK